MEALREADLKTSKGSQQRQQSIEYPSSSNFIHLLRKCRNFRKAQGTEVTKPQFIGKHLKVHPTVRNSLLISSKSASQLFKKLKDTRNSSDSIYKVPLNTKRLSRNGSIYKAPLNTKRPSTRNHRSRTNEASSAHSATSLAAHSMSPVAHPDELSTQH